MRRTLLALLLCTPFAALADGPHQYGANPAACPHYTIPRSLQQYTTHATVAEANGTGLVTGSYSGVKAAGTGGVCTGQVFKVTRPGLKLWRVFSHGAANNRMGGWWSIDKSDNSYNTRRRWRTANGVCGDWNPDADMIFSCSVPVGNFILLGPTQSATCNAAIGAGRLDSTHYPASSTVQVFWQGWRAHTPNTQGCTTPARITRWTDARGFGAATAAGSGSAKAKSKAKAKKKSP